MKRLLNSVKHYGCAAALCGAVCCVLLTACASIGLRIQTDRLEDQAYNSVNGILTVDCSPNPLPSEWRWSVEYDTEVPSNYTWHVFSNGVGTASWNQRLYDYDDDDLIRIRLVSYWKNSTGNTIIAGLHPSQRIDLNLSSNDQDLSSNDQDLSSINIGKIQIHLTWTHVSSTTTNMPKSGVSMGSP